ncbi:MAG: cytochrome c oxidase accessory protein CcoG [Rhodospirillales bacterium]
MTAIAPKAPPQPPHAWEDEPLYADRVKIYPQAVRGAFRRFKWAALFVLLAIYYAVPWLRWDRGPGAPDQAVLIDMPHRRAYFFFIEIWPQEVYYITGLLILGAIGLFAATSVAGRVWCGFTCPQTVWTDLFMWVERMIEGDRAKRIRLDQSPLSAAKLARKLAKHAAWLLIAFATGGAWIMYFNDAPTALREVFTGAAGPTVYGFVALFTATTYVLAGWAREQVCIYMCPWPRFQGAMLDENSLVVTYADWRGEPRGKAKPGQSFDGRGHCVDCGLCQRVCPTGVDIRQGQQLACIGCGLCIDACNSIMPHFNLPGNLIAYDSIANQAARAKGEAARLRLVRPRTIVYAACLAIVGAVMLGALLTRSTLDVSILPDRAPLYVLLMDGDLRNSYTFKVLNKAREERRFILALDGLARAHLAVDGLDTAADGSASLTAGGDAVGTFHVFVRAPKSSLGGHSTPFRFVLREPATGKRIAKDAVFRGPER